jgi:DNA-binding NarL/FixJ family response regulator
MSTKMNIVLLTDDSNIICNGLISTLENGVDSEVVLHATNYEEAFGIMEYFKPDYVLLDICPTGKTGMPMHGDTKKKYHNSKGIVITNLANKHYKDFCESIGVSCFLEKTTDLESIPGTISEAELN